MCISAPKVPPWIPISRVNQLDAAQIDERNLSKMKDQLKSVFSFYVSVPSHFMNLFVHAPNVVKYGHALHHEAFSFFP